MWQLETLFLLGRHLGRALPKAYVTWWFFCDTIDKKPMDKQHMTDQNPVNQNTVSQSSIDLSPSNLKTLSGPANKLIEVVSNAIGILYEPTKITRNAKANAKATIIEAATKMHLEEIDKRALMRVLNTESKRQLNIEQIVKKSIEFSPDENATNQQPEADWIADFFNACQDCSCEQMQTLWAKLLSGEVDKPGSFSRRTINAIKLLSVEEANLFTKLCANIWIQQEASLGMAMNVFMDMDDNGRYSDESWGFDGSKCVLLEQINIARMEDFELDIKREYNITFFGKKHKLKPLTDNQTIYVIALTPVGEELFKIAGVKPNQAYYQHTLQYFNDLGILA